MVSSIRRKILFMHNPNIFLLKIALMERPTLPRAARKNNEILNLAILKIPDPSKLVEMESRPNNNFIRYYNSKKKENIAMHAVKIEKAKLLTNLEIYEWRNQTQFPIVKTKFVQIIENNEKFTPYITLKVYIEYCPIKLNHLYDINLGQTLYLLKQSMIGFERLYSRFGGFQITNSLISVNQKGLCKVWFNQNLASNHLPKTKYSEVVMVSKIIKLIQMHSNESKGSKKIFSALKNCKSFFSALIRLEQLASAFKILVPSKFIFLTEQKEYPRSAQEIINHHKAESVPIQSFSSVRLSIKSTRPNKKNSFINQEEHSRIKSRKNQEMSPSLIKRFKSQDKIRQASTMNISEGETTHSRNIKSSNLGLFFGSPRQTGYDNSQISENSMRKKNLRKWIQQSSFLMGSQQDRVHKKDKDKKELSHSEAFKPQSRFRKNIDDRKFSANYSASKFCNPRNRFNGKKSVNHFYLSKDSNEYALQFKEVLDGEDINSNDIVTPRKSWVSDQEDSVKIKEHTEKIVQANGWRVAPDLLMSGPRELNSSFHAGEDEPNPALRNRELEKLGKMGRRQIIMSMLPQQAQNN